MSTETEELEVREFLKRAEVKTMRKDLQKMREVDALKEKGKILKQAEQEKITEQKIEKEAKQEAAEREVVLQKQSEQEHSAMKELRQYASEQEKQQIFLLESDRLATENQLKDINQQKEPPLLLQKNNALIGKREWEEKLKTIVADEEKIEKEQQTISGKAETSNVPSEKQSLEKRMWELDSQRQSIEKKRWEIEKEIQNKEKKAGEYEKELSKLSDQKNELNRKIREIDVNLRNIFSAIIARVEETRAGKLAEQKKAAEERATVATERKERIQREQWTKPSPSGQERTAGLKMTDEKRAPTKAPMSFKEKLAESAKAEEERRKQFLQDVNKSLENK